MVDTRTKSERLAFDASKHVMGSLCLRGHDAGGRRSMRHIKPSGGPGGCVQCTRDRAKSWAAENPERHAASTRRRDLGRSRKSGRDRWPIAVMTAGALSRAKARGLPAYITAEAMKAQWRQQDGRCFWTGLEMDFHVGGARHPMRPSLDRLNPVLGYVPGNVVWSTNFANRARGELSAAEFAVLMTSMGFSGIFTSHF